MSNKHYLGLVMILLLVICLIPSLKGTASPEPCITILSPGEGSLLTSPISLSSEIMPDPQGMIRVTLSSRNGDLLARQVIRVKTNGTSPTLFTTDIHFEIPSEQTEALLTLAVQDAFFRTISVRSVVVTLASTGETALQPPTSVEPWSDITHPQSGEEVDGGELSISGSVTPISNRPITIELVSEGGRVVGSTHLPIQTPGEKLDFNVNLYYSYIKEATDARLVLRQNHYPYDEAAILDSLTLTVLP